MNKEKFNQASDDLNMAQDGFKLCCEGKDPDLGKLRPLIDVLQKARNMVAVLRESEGIER